MGSVNFSQLIYLVMSFQILRQLGILVSSSILIFPYLVMSGILVRLVLFIPGILSDSEGTPCIKLLFWLQMLWLEVVFTTVIPCLEVSLFLIFAGSSVFKTVFLEWLLIPPNTYISLL